MGMENNQASWWRPAIAIFAKFSAWLLFPLLIGFPLGQWLDRRYGTAPWLFLAAVGLSFIISMGGLIAGALKEYRNIEAEARGRDKKN